MKLVERLHNYKIRRVKFKIVRIYGNNLLENNE